MKTNLSPIVETLRRYWLSTLFHSLESLPLSTRCTHLCYPQVNFEKGIQVLKIFKEQSSKTCILDDFGFYETREKMIQERKSKEQQFPKQVKRTFKSHIKNKFWHFKCSCEFFLLCFLLLCTFLNPKIHSVSCLFCLIKHFKSPVVL